MRTGLKIFSLALLLTVGSLCTAPRARAMDPVTLALLAPAAMRMAEATHPYLMNGLACGARGLAKTGISAFKTLYLPLGAVQCTRGLPFGLLGSGVNNLIEGGAAPFEMAFHACMLPVNLFGVDI